MVDEQNKRLSSFSIKVSQFLRGLKNTILRKTLRFIFYKYKVESGVYSNISINEEYKNIVLYLTNKNSIHLGDGLIFLPMIVMFQLKKDKNLTYKIYNSLLKLYSSITKIDSPINKEIKKDHLFITSFSEFFILSRFFKRLPTIAFDINDSEIKLPLTRYITNFLGLNNYENWKRFIIKKKSNKNYDKYILLNLEVASGEFRIKKHTRDFLFKKAFQEAEKRNSKLVLTGLIHNKDKKFENSRIIDMRGKTIIGDIVSLIGSPDCLKVFAFDSVVMHIALIYEKSHLIAFRGKSNLESENFHFRSVHLSFGEKINYL